MWEVLKTNGFLIITFPVAKNFNEEFSDKDVYGLTVRQKEEKFFFQRLYNEVSIKKGCLIK